MSFVNNLSRGLSSTGVVSQQPVATANPFSTVQTPKANPFGGAQMNRPSGQPAIPGGMPKPSFGKPAGIPSAPAPNFNSGKTAPVVPSAPKEVEVKEKEVEPKIEVEKVEAAPVAETKIEKVEEVKVAPKVPSFVKKIAENKEDVILKEDVATKEEPIQETLLGEVPVKEEVKPAKKPRTRKKAATTKKEDVPVDSPMTDDEMETIDKIFKMPTTKITYAEAVKATRGTFVDEEWEAAKKEFLEESDAIVIENGMTGSAINAVSVQLNRLRDKVWTSFVETKVILENLSRKDTEGLIERVKYMNMEGSSSEMRKRSAVVSVMNYKTPNGDIVNLYEVYDETKARFEFLKGVMETISFKSSSLITMNSALKMDKSN